MFTVKRKMKWYRRVALFLATVIFLEVVAPTSAYALTGGPSQPEVQGFTPVGTSEMVNVFTGDFNYNIPLLDVGGYPINISYSAAPTTDQEASWVGLGWNINPGVINRNMRSLPDDFNGDQIVKQKNMKPNITYGVNVGGSIEVFGLDFLSLTAGLDFSYNNYTGVGFGVSLNPNFSMAASNTGSLTAGIGFSASSTSGVDVSPNLGFSTKLKNSDDCNTKLGVSVGLSYNSRAGLKSLTIDGTLADRKEKHTGISRSVSYSFATPTYVPQSEFPMVSEGGSFRVTGGGDLFGNNPNLYIGGYYSTERLASRSMTYNAYGYLYSHNYSNSRKESVLHDFNREKDNAFNPKYSTNLALTNYTYDIYSVSGQGIGGTYRPYRNDIGVVADPYTHTTGSSNISLGAEIGGGNAVHAGVNINVAMTFNDAGKWQAPGVSKVLDFKATDPGNPLYEPVYFKQAGEVNPLSSTDFYTMSGGMDARKVNLVSGGEQYVPTRTLIGNNGESTVLGTSSDSPNRTYKKERQARNQNISFLTAQEAKLFAIEKKVRVYPFNQHTLDENTRMYAYSAELDRTGSSLSRSRPDHISEISVLRPDGARYFYGIPAYNSVQKEFTFSVENQQLNCADGLVDYNHGNDNTTGNDQGMDNYFEGSTLPAYAHSYMLTAIVSSDYVDITGNGISDDDFGSYTRINYSRLADYQWRTPFTKASHNEGFKSIDINTPESDDKGTYVYGKKDLWYVHSIETRTHLAEFILEDRNDGQGVIDENGGYDPAGPQMKLLRQIRLYAKNDKMRNGDNAVPIKVVNFEYDYSLCTGIDNHKDNVTGFKKSGKLTLRKIYFTYGKSFKGKLNAYKFNYDYEDANFNYNIKAYDRWGNYKPNEASSCDPRTSPLSTAEFPYAEQDKAKADVYARAWSLTEIELPSGGKISVDYESDDYAYVQNRQAMQMFKISGTGNAANVNPVNTTALMEGHSSNSYLFFKLQTPITAASEGEANQMFKRDYLRDVEQVAFRFMINVNKPSKGENFEYVPGYVQVEKDGSGSKIAGVATYGASGGTYNYAYIKVKQTGVQLDGGGDLVHPVCVAAWQFARLYMPRVAFQQPTPSDKLSLQAIDALVSTYKSVKQFIGGFNRAMRNEGFGKEFIKEKSWIRLNNPNGKKLGGGHRVKRIVLNDQWSAMNNNRTNYQNSMYGQEYDYTTEVQVDGITKTISSGVASYEPLIGGEENPFRQPVFQKQSLVLAPSNMYYVEEPFGESFFPSPSVGYSKVTVRNLQYDNVTMNATGKVVNEFYTAKDFPTLTRKTQIDVKPSKTGALLRLFSLCNYDNYSASQGYVVELNDMHGKEKATWVYQEGKDVPISGVEYKYKTTEVSASYLNKSLSVPKLDNTVDVMTKNPDASGKFITRKVIGVDMDMVSDMRSYNNSTTSGGGQLNLELSFIGIFPAAFPLGFPNYSQEKTNFSSVVLTKVINRFGLLEKTIAHDAGAKVSTDNLLWDAETGEVLLTKTTNQFDDPVYNFNYPAHWAYDRMGPSYKNLGTAVSVSGSLASLPSANQYFALGDEVIIKRGVNTTYESQLYVVTDVAATGVVLKDRSGAEPAASSSYKIKIIRSGRRNMQSMSVGSVTALANPMQDVDKDGNYDQISFTEVLNAGAVEYNSFWKIFCDCAFNNVGDGSGEEPHDANQYLNDYLKGTKGIWRPNTNWVYLTERKQSVANNNTNIRKDGAYATFAPFWTAPTNASADWSAPNKNAWQYATTLTEFSPFGYEVESKDALERYSAAVYGYNNTLAISMGNNARYKELAFDGFEDYGFGECQFDHFSYREADAGSFTISPEQSHTGRYSIRIVPEGEVTTTRTMKTK